MEFVHVVFATMLAIVFVAFFFEEKYEFYDKYVVAFTGAAAFIIIGSLLHVIEPQEVPELINDQVLLLLVSVYIFVTAAEESGLFHVVSVLLLKFCRGDLRRYFLMSIVIPFILAIFINNISGMIVVASLTLTMARYVVRISHKNLLMYQVFMANTGTMVLMISGIPALIISARRGRDFLYYISISIPAALLLFISYLILFLYRERDFRGYDEEMRRRIEKIDVKAIIERDPIYFYSTAILFASLLISLVIFPSMGVPPEVVTTIFTGLILAARRRGAGKLMEEIDLSIVLFFIALFIIVGIIEESGLLQAMGRRMGETLAGRGDIMLILVLVFATIVSAIVDAVTVSLLLLPFVEGMALGDPILVSGLSRALLFGAVLGGNLTPIGSPAGLIALRAAEQLGEPISRPEFMRKGMIVTILGVALLGAYLVIRF